jgi:perosamine synthetase
MTPISWSQVARNPVQLLADWLHGGGLPQLPQGEGRQAFFTESGRAAIALAARLWAIGKTDEVLVPAYNCGSEISPLIATGARVEMYRVDSSAHIEVADVLGRITPRTRLVCVTHYFGRPAELEQLVTVCRQSKIKLLEDCALSLFSLATGLVGDGVIFSLRKSLPASDGGVLLLRGADGAVGTPAIRPGGDVALRGVLSLVKKWLGPFAPNRPGVLRPNQSASAAPSGPSLPDIPPSYYWPSHGVVRNASRFARGLLVRTDQHMVIRRRRDNYDHLRRNIDGIPGVSLLWREQTLPENMCPLGLPVIVEDRLRWWRDLTNAGIAVSRWWEGYHRGLDWTAFPEARLLKDCLLLLPVHQDLTSHHMAYIGDRVRSLASSRPTPTRIRH